MIRPLVILAAAFASLSFDASAQETLKDAFKDEFRVGVAVNESWFDNKNPISSDLVQTQFNSISPENVLKWDATEPQEGQFQFAAADRYVDFGVHHGMFVIGHTLVWHSQTPAWVFKNANGAPVDRDTLLARMKNHIETVVGRYKGRVKGWDVVNEVMGDNGTLRDSPWHKIIGDDYISKAFEFAHAADPDAELYYNDYGIEGGPKHDGAVALIKQLQVEEVPVTGVGIQEHVGLNWPPIPMIDSALTDFEKLGVKIEITELDVDVLPAKSRTLNADVGRNEAADPALNPYSSGLPDSVQQSLARRYADLFGVYLKHKGAVSRVTVWGVTDGDSWLNNWPIKGRTSYPLLFDRTGHAKPAVDAVINRERSLSSSSLLNSSTAASGR